MKKIKRNLNIIMVFLYNKPEYISIIFWEKVKSLLNVSTS